MLALPIGCTASCDKGLVFYMATRDELYAKFGITAEASQLFETELGTLLLAVSAIENGWHVTPDPVSARKTLDQIEAHTLGRLLGVLKGKVPFDEHLAERFDSALKARNRLNHGFYEKHNFKIQTDEGRDLMIADLEKLHEELFQVWRMASSLTAAMAELVAKLRSDPPTE
jgi:cytochrome c556